MDQGEGEELDQAISGGSPGLESPTRRSKLLCVYKLARLPFMNYFGQKEITFNFPSIENVSCRPLP